MKYIIVMLVALSAAGAYLYFNPDDRPEILRAWLKGTPLEPAPTTTHVYKWRDSDGQWQITDRPPEGNISYKELEYSSDANILPSITVDEDQ